MQVERKLPANSPVTVNLLGTVIVTLVEALILYKFERFKMKLRVWTDQNLKRVKRVRINNAVGYC